MSILPYEIINKILGYNKYTEIGHICTYFWKLKKKQNETKGELNQLIFKSLELLKEKNYNTFVDFMHKDIINLNDDWEYHNMTQDDIEYHVFWMYNATMISYNNIFTNEIIDYNDGGYLFDIWDYCSVNDEPWIKNEFTLSKYSVEYFINNKLYYKPCDIMQNKDIETKMNDYICSLYCFCITLLKFEIEIYNYGKIKENDYKKLYKEICMQLLSLEEYTKKNTKIYRQSNNIMFVLGSYLTKTMSIIINDD